MTMLEVRDGLWTVEFKGAEIARTDTEKQLPAGVSWDDVTPADAKYYLRWVEMELYKVEPGQEDPDEQIRLPEGGYFYHVAHQTVCYHRTGQSCSYQGVSRLAGSTEADLLPCPECKPQLLWDPHDPNPDDPQLLADPQLIVDVEPVRHDLYREETALGIVRRVTGRRLTVPAGLLLERAKQNDPGIRAVFARPGR